MQPHTCHAMRKRVIKHMKVQTVLMQSDRGLHCPLTDSGPSIGTQGEVS